MAAVAAAATALSSPSLLSCVHAGSSTCRPSASVALGQRTPLHRSGSGRRVTGLRIANSAWSHSRRRLTAGVAFASAASGSSALPPRPSENLSADGSILQEEGSKGSGSGLQGYTLAGAGALLAAAVAAALAAGPGGLPALLAQFGKSGFAAAFSLIFVSEIGDKTFFIAALLAMRHARWQVLTGASAALAIMTVISVAIGRLFKRVPQSIQMSLPLGEYLAVALLVYFGLKSLRDAWKMRQAKLIANSDKDEESDELAGAEQLVSEAESKLTSTSPWAVISETFGLIFLAEWGDRSMLATIALGASQSPVGVATGATTGHVLATLLAVIGGSLLSDKISEQTVALTGGILFLVFAAATLFGVF